MSGLYAPPERPLVHRRKPERQSFWKRLFRREEKPKTEYSDLARKLIAVHIRETTP